MRLKETSIVVLSMLRGINVANRKVLMADLKKLYQELPLDHVQTYIQSGNVIFQTTEDVLPTLVLQLEEKIKAHYGFYSPVLLRTLDEMHNIQKNNPFLTETSAVKTLHVTFLAETPDSTLIEKLNGFVSEPDRFVIVGKEIYLYCPEGYGHTKLSNTFFESKLHLAATTRNWKTVTELSRLMAVPT